MTHRSVTVIALLFLFPGCTTDRTADDAPLQATTVFNQSMFGINVAADGFPGAGRITELGAKWVRIELHHRIGIDHLKGTLQSYKNAGIKRLVILDYASVAGYPGAESVDPNNLNNASTCGGWPEWRVQFIEHVKTTARSLCGLVDAYEIWNEPNMVGGCG